MSKQPNTPTIVVDTSKLTGELARFKADIRRDIRESKTIKPSPKSLNEAASRQPEDYREKLIEALKDKKRIEFSAGITSRKRMVEAIGALSGGSAIPEVWSSEVERLHVYPNSKFLSVPGLVNWKDDITGAPGDTINVPTVDKVVAVAVTEGTEPTVSAGTVSSIPVTLATIGAAYYMTKADVEELIPGTIDALNEGLGAANAEKVDTDWLGWLENPNVAIRGTLDITAALTGSAIAEAIGSLRAGTYEPAFLLVHPVAMVSLLQDQAFYDASQFGTREVIERGAVANYFGVDIIQTPLIDGTGGTYRNFMVAKGALVGAIKRQPEIETDYIIESGRHYIRMDMRFGGTIVHTDGVFEIKSVD